MSTSPVTHNESMEDETGIDRSLDDIMDSGSRANEVCRDFQRGYCPRGDRCWFKHVPSENQSQDADLAAPGVVASLGGRALCRDYIRGHCRRGVECPFFHVKGGERCRDFDRLQDCRRGIFCPFLHVSLQSRTTPTSPMSPGLLPVNQNFGFERESESVYDRSLPPQYFPRRPFDPYTRAPKPVADMKPAVIKTELCRDWARFNGDCPRGASCQYLHGNPGDICRDFSRRGRCYRGDNCPFSHQIAPEVKPEVCMKFMKGECTRGQACLYTHPSHRADRGQEVCRKFLRGECTRGVSCTYYHPHMGPGSDDGQHEYSGNDYN